MNQWVTGLLQHGMAVAKGVHLHHRFLVHQPNCTFPMKIAVTSKNRKTITEHAGKCRKFWVYEVVNRQVTDKQLLELSLEQSFHENAHTATPQDAHPLDGASLLITASAGNGLKARLAQRGLEVCVTTDTDPDHAVAAWLNGTLSMVTQESHDCDHGHDHSHHD